MVEATKKRENQRLEGEQKEKQTNKQNIKYRESGETETETKKHKIREAIWKMLELHSVKTVIVRKMKNSKTHF